MTSTESGVSKETITADEGARARAADAIYLNPAAADAIYLNRAECHFSPIRELVVNNADYVDWDAFPWVLARHIQHRNGPQRAKRVRILDARNQIAA
jgi:hypothetical protein